MQNQNYSTTQYNQYQSDALRNSQMIMQKLQYQQQTQNRVTTEIVHIVNK